MYVLIGAVLAWFVFGGIVLIDQYFSKKSAKKKKGDPKDQSFTVPIGGMYSITVGTAGSGGSDGKNKSGGAGLNPQLISHEWFDDDVPVLKKPKSKKKKKKSKKPRKKK